MSRHPAADIVTVALASPHGASTPSAHGWPLTLLLLLLLIIIIILLCPKSDFPVHAK